MRRQRCGHPAAHQACHQAGVAGRGETLRTGSRARCRTRGQVVGHTISQTSVRLAPSSDLRGSRHDSVSYRIPMSELGVTGDDDACKCESNGASRVCVCMRHSRETGISLLVWSVFRRMCVWTVVRVGTVCARFRGGASAVCLFPFRRRAGHDPVNRAGCSASGRCSRSGTWARDYGQAFFCPTSTTRNIACNIVITDLSPGCRAVELSSCRESVEPLSRPLSRGFQGLACRACQVAVE